MDKENKKDQENKGVFGSIQHVAFNIRYKQNTSVYGALRSILTVKQSFSVKFVKGIWGYEKHINALRQDEMRPCKGVMHTIHIWQHKVLINQWPRPWTQTYAHGVKDNSEIGKS